MTYDMLEDKFLITSDVALLRGIASDLLVKLLVVAKIQIFPFDCGVIGLIRLIDYVSKSKGEVILPISTVGVYMRLSSFSHASQLLTKSMTSSSMVGQK